MLTANKIKAGTLQTDLPGFQSCDFWHTNF